MGRQYYLKRGFVFLILVIAFSISGCSNDIQDPEYDSELVRHHEIVKTEDMSNESLTIVIKRYRVIVPSDITKAELEATLIQIVEDKISENPDLDEVIVLAYDKKEDAGGDYTIGKVEWRPDADWNGVTSIIATTNDRSSYQYNFEFSDNMGNGVDRPDEGNVEIYDTYNDRLERSSKLIEENFQ